MLGYLLDPFIQISNVNGTPIVGAKIYVYNANTTNLAITYNDFEGHLNTNPVITDDFGNATIIADDSIEYDISVHNKNGLLLFTKKNVSIDKTSSAGVDTQVVAGYGVTVEKNGNIFTVSIDKDIIPTKTSQLVNDSGFITSASGEWIDVPLTPLMPNYFVTEDRYTNLRINNTLRLGILTFAVRIINSNFGNGWVDIFSFEPFGNPRPEDEILQFRLFQEQDAATTSKYELYKWIYGNINPNKGKIQISFVYGERSLNWTQPTSSFVFAF